MTKLQNIKKLSASIHKGRVVLSIANEDQDRFTQTHDLVDEAEEAQEVTLTVSDFYANHTAYRVFGLVLDADGATIKRYWEPTSLGTGIQGTMMVTQAGPQETFIIGARPDDSSADRPWPFDSREPAGVGGLPGTGGTGSGGGGTGGGSGGGGTSGG